MKCVQLTWLNDFDLGTISVKQLLSLLWFNLSKLFDNKFIISSIFSFSAVSEAFFQSPGKLLKPSMGHKFFLQWLLFSKNALVSLSSIAFDLWKIDQSSDGLSCCLALLIEILLNLKSKEAWESMAALMSLSSMVSCSLDQIELKGKLKLNIETLY